VDVAETAEKRISGFLNKL